MLCLDLESPIVFIKMIENSRYCVVFYYLSMHTTQFSPSLTWFHGTSIYNSPFVDEIKNIDTIDAYKKSRLVMQIYNDDDKTKILIQTPTI